MTTLHACSAGRGRQAEIIVTSRGRDGGPRSPLANTSFHALEDAGRLRVTAQRVETWVVRREPYEPAAKALHVPREPPRGMHVVT